MLLSVIIFVTTKGQYPAVLGTWSTSPECLISVYTQYYALCTYDGLDPYRFNFDI